VDFAAAHQLVDATPEGDNWLHDIKFDGCRMHAQLDRGAVKLLMRTGLDWTSKYPLPRHLNGQAAGTGPVGHRRLTGLSQSAQPG
jgi:ATP-dependent DNA ligase